MLRLPRRFLVALLALFPFTAGLFGLVLLISGSAWAADPARSSFAVSLPAALFSDPDLCAHAPCGDVLPGADSFSPRIGKPPYVEGYRTEAGRKHLLGYIFLSTDIVDIPGYSGKPVVTLIGMDARGIITGTRILKHSEPILLSGIPESELLRFIRQYVGKFVGDKIEIGQSMADQGIVGLDAISGATVTVISENQVIMRCGRAIARQVGIIKTEQRQPVALAADTSPRDWSMLVQEGSIRRLTVEPGALGLPATGRPYIDLHFGYLNAPSIGMSVLGVEGYENLMSRLKPGDNAIFVVASGMASFKGFGFVHGGIYDRILMAQDMDTFTFRDIDYLDLYEVRAAGAPAYSESAIFVLHSSSFSPAYPWRLIFRGSRPDRRSGLESFVNIDREYWLPSRLLEGGRPAYRPPDPTWLRVWKGNPVQTALFLLFLIVAVSVYAGRDILVRRSSRRDKRWVTWPKYAIWSVSIGFVGFTLMAQPSITQVLTLFHALLFKWDWALFLSDPFIFLFWWFILGSIVVWGRGLFCGWLCPYGALTEMLYKIVGTLGLRRFQGRLPDAVHERLKWLKYGIFLGLLAVSFHSMELAETLAEIEPFKTTFLVGVWNRSWPFVTFWGVLIVAALFVERPFCKYLCPLGASLAIPSTFRWKPLQRKVECGPCNACGDGCESRAIDRKGRIDQRECLLCLDCTIMYYDDRACPPLAQERKQRQKRGEMLTPIGANGYYIPLHPVTAISVSAETPTIVAVTPRLSVPAWFGAELLDLFPWRASLRRRDILMNSVGMALAVLVGWAWLLGAAGRLGPLDVLGWWLAWSAYELAARMNSKPFIREGAWWARRFRPASWADMAAYVGLKNLALASLLFFVINNFGVAALFMEMPALPEIHWLTQ